MYGVWIYVYTCNESLQFAIVNEQTMIWTSSGPSQLLYCHYCDTLAKGGRSGDKTVMMHDVRGHEISAHTAGS